MYQPRRSLQEQLIRRTLLALPSCVDAVRPWRRLDRLCAEPRFAGCTNDRFRALLERPELQADGFSIDDIRMLSKSFLSTPRLYPARRRAFAIALVIARIAFATVF